MQLVNKSFDFYDINRYNIRACEIAALIYTLSNVCNKLAVSSEAEKWKHCADIRKLEYKPVVVFYIKQTKGGKLCHVTQVQLGNFLEDSIILR